MFDPISLGVMGSLAALKYGTDVARESSNRKMEAAKAKYSPWTGMMPGAIPEANFAGDAAAGIAGGVQLGQGMKQAEANTNLTNAAARSFPQAPTPTPSSEFAGSAGALNPMMSAPQQQGPSLFAQGQNPYQMLLQQGKGFDVDPRLINGGFRRQ